MDKMKENLNDTNFLLGDDLKDEYITNKTLCDNTQLLLEEKSIINENNLEKIKTIPNINNNDNIKEIIFNNDNAKENCKDMQEIIKQQNILLNDKTPRFDEFLSLSYTENSNLNRNIPQTLNIENACNTKRYETLPNNSIFPSLVENLENTYNTKRINFGVVFPTEKIIKTFNYKNNQKSKIICFKIINNNNNYFKVLVKKEYFNLKPFENVDIQIELNVPFMRDKMKIENILKIIDINNNILGEMILTANVEIPKLLCLRYENFLKDNSIPLVVLNINKNQNQKISVPFKNISNKDIEIKFNLLSLNNENNLNKISDCDINFESDGNLFITSHSVNNLNLMVDVQNYKTDKNTNKIKKVIKGNIINTKLNYFFCFCVIVNNNK